MKREKVKMIGETLKLALLLCAALIFNSQISYGQSKSNESAITKSTHLENHGKNAETFNFPSDQWRYLIVKLNGKYQKDFTKNPSQKFTVTVTYGTKNTILFDDDLYGNKEISLDLKSEGSESFDVNVQVKLVSVHGAAQYASGNVDVTAFREKPGLFYVTEVIYDDKNAILLKRPDDKVGKETLEKNDTDEESSGTYKVTYTETNSLTWEKSFEHSESVGFSFGYKPASATGGFEAMVSLAGNFKTAYKTGRTEQKTESIERSITYKVPPRTSKRIFAVQTTNTYRMPYILKGYTLDNNGEKIAPFEKKDTCVFKGVQSTRIEQVTVKETEGLQADKELKVIAEWPSVLK